MDDDVDPLDAFMVSMDEQAEKDITQSNKPAKELPKTNKITLNTPIPESNKGF